MKRCSFRAFSMLTAALLTSASVVSAQSLVVVQPATHADSRNLRDLDRGSAPVNGPTAIRTHHGELPEELEIPALGPDQPDPILQLLPGPLISAADGLDFEGVGQNGFIPSDNNIAVGPNHIVETVNVKYAVYNKAGVLQTSGFLKSLWTPLGGSCAANNGGDPIVVYDRFADRWLISQLGSLNAPYSECIAVSKTNDPTGAYSLYSYSFGAALNDYPKFGVWPTATNSAYLATYNLFYGSSGAELCAYDRAAMIAGVSAIALCTVQGSLGSYSYLPADVDGSTPPLNGTPGYFVDLNTTSSLGVYRMFLDFATPSNSFLSARTFIGVSQFAQANDVPQPGTTMTLDPLSDRLMYRLAFRMFADHEAMVATHSVSTGGVAGKRWYELRSPVSNAGMFTLFQEGTFAPADGNHRWMGSIAMDKSGNIGLGYSVSGPSTYPSIRYTGRVPSDAAGTMQTEAILINGFGSQLSYDRWGDYSSMQIDPVDDCTFWYVNEYYPVSSSSAWHTRIGSFKFNSCGVAPAPDFALSANPTSFSRAQGASGQSTITVNPINGFNGSVDLSVIGCPTNAACSIVPSSVTAGGTATLTVTPGFGTPTGPYTVTVQGSGAPGTHSTSVDVTVTPAVSNFTLGLSSSSLTVRRKSNGSVTVNLSPNPGSSSVTLSVLGLPSKLSASFSVNPVATLPGSSQLQISANPNAAIGTVDVTVRGTNGTFTQDQILHLTITR